MKKLLLVMAAVLCVATVSAKKSVIETAKSSDWSVGLRATYGVQAVAECFYTGDKYFEGRLGIYGGACADFTVLHNWNCCNWNWTPKVGKWFLDAGCGASIGGAKHLVTAGVVGDVKFGLKFNKVPIRLAVDYSPVIGIYGLYPAKYFDHAVGFNTSGFYNFALSATWCF